MKHTYIITTELGIELDRCVVEEKLSWAMLMMINFTLSQYGYEIKELLGSVEPLDGSCGGGAAFLAGGRG